MGKLKTHDWQYRSKKQQPSNNNVLNLALQSAVYLANAEYNEKKKIRQIMAQDKVAKETVDELSNKYTDWDLGCAALVLHRRFGKDAHEVCEFLNDVQDLTREFINDDVTGDDIWDMIRDEIGLDITREY